MQMLLKLSNGEKVCLNFYNKGSLAIAYGVEWRITSSYFSHIRAIAKALSPSVQTVRILSGGKVYEFFD
jgi:hypothetical protein